MPLLNINEDEKTILVTALTHERVRLMKEWTRAVEDYESSVYSRELDCAEIDDHADAVTDLRRKIEVADYAPKAAWHHKRGWLRNEAFAEHCKKKFAENVTGEGIKPGTWTTLPEGFDLDDWMFDVTDPEDKVTAGADTQATADGKVRIDITVGGKLLTIDGHEYLLEALNDLNRGY